VTDDTPQSVKPHPVQRRTASAHRIVARRRQPWTALKPARATRAGRMPPPRHAPVSTPRGLCDARTERETCDRGIPPFGFGQIERLAREEPLQSIGLLLVIWRNAYLIRAKKDRDGVEVHCDDDGAGGQQQEDTRLGQGLHPTEHAHFWSAASSRTTASTGGTCPPCAGGTARP
jgi:hypothetical protein